MTFLNPNLANTYVDDTVGWATGHNKEAVAGTLRHQLKKMVHWCKTNKIKINADKTHVIFNEYNPADKIECGNTTIKTIESIRYLGAELRANTEDNNSTFLVSTQKIAKNIVKRCKYIKRLRKY